MKGKSLKGNDPKIGVAVLVFKEGKVLLGKRIGSVTGSGMYNAPGGKLEHLESLAVCGAREVFEETGVEIQNPRFLCVTNVTHFPPEHHVLLTLAADWKAGEPVAREKEKCESWSWFHLDSLPELLTPATANGIKALQSKEIFFDV